ncbi:DUF6747 family protein [Ascidiimonas sp. W6]|uniref:DUF6747 family protein n=1 Tax=Ascidiimonas meishanensis TaxID=3128903 RepID=UPI0030EF287A
MNKFLLLKDIYTEAFKNLGHYMVASYFKILTWFCVGCIGIVMYAFLYRMATGYNF